MENSSILMLCNDFDRNLDKKLGVDTFPDPVGKFRGKIAAILDFAGGAALQAVSECPLRR